MKSLCLALFCLFAVQINAQEFFEEPSILNDTIERLDEVILQADVLVGSKFKAKNLAGSTYFISSEELRTFNYGDINRILRTIPGVNVVEEEGFGIRPSIGLRGTSPSRSSKITLMEDGVLIAPAPYSAPAAYYFPTISRMQSIEILKGGSQIQYGPFTTGGAINLVSTQIPSQFQGRVVASMGSFNTRNTYVNVGDNNKNFGYSVEYNNRNSEGFKEIDFSEKNTGFNGNDYVAKFRVNTNTDAKVFQSLSFKFQTSNEDANETYLGLTQADFDANPNRRYLGSEADQITTSHQQIMLTHLLIPTDNITITTKAYRNNFKRNWYKLNDVQLNNETYSLVSILDNPTENQDAYLALTGLVDTPENALRVRANNRRYYAEGVQTVANFKFNSSKFKHDLDLGVRYHKDAEDRFQWNDGYQILNQQLIQTSAGVAGSQDNRIGEAEAIAAHTLYNFTYKKLTLTPGIRYESIIRRNINYGTADLDRTGENISSSENKTDVWIPGMGALYAFNDFYMVFSSVHKGFSPPGANDAEKPESSINSEAGFRFKKKGLQGEIIGFYNQFSNLLGADSNAAGGTGSGDLFNAGEAKVFGIEMVATYDFLEKTDSKFKLPVTITYTYTDTELTSNFNSGVEAWGSIASGDEIPYISKHQASLLMGFEHTKFNVFLSGKFNGAFRTLAGQGAIPGNELVESNLIFDVSSKYFLSKNVSLTGNVFNVFDSAYAVSRVPAGLRPGMPFAVNFGIIAQF
uniref:TonB-dependent receptor family protein n=1 Tax=Flavobacterium sp. TaxID=239 RepID=UPI004049ACB5